MNNKMKEQDIPDLNIFMMCEKLNEDALREIPEGYHIRNIRKDELDIWKEFPFDNEEDKKNYYDFITEYFDNVYKLKEEEFYNSCLFICDNNDKPIATCFAWRAYDNFYTIHWFKVLKDYENNGLGRAILSEVMKQIPKDKYPVYLHTQPGSYRAIKLYSDFGFSILTDEYIGDRKNEYKESILYLKHFMGEERYSKLVFKDSDGEFSKAASKSNKHEF